MPSHFPCLHTQTLSSVAKAPETCTPTPLLQPHFCTLAGQPPLRGGRQRRSQPSSFLQRQPNPLLLVPRPTRVCCSAMLPNVCIPPSPCAGQHRWALSLPTAPTWHGRGGAHRGCSPAGAPRAAAWDGRAAPRRRTLSLRTAVWHFWCLRTSTRRCLGKAALLHPCCSGHGITTLHPD